MQENVSLPARPGFRCGHAERANRSTRALFRCKRCGFEIHADLQAARNIAVKAQSLVSGWMSGTMGLLARP
ncbi:MAG: zinc ribbon domain-containing protein [Bacillota bacterium]